MNVNPINEHTNFQTRSLDLNDNTNKESKYKIKRKPIGKGSFANVYYATCSLGKDYAIKSISLSKIKNSNINKFMREIEIVEKMNHQNIVKCYDVFKTNLHWYIVLEYCNFGTFELLINAFKNIDIKQKEKWGIYYLVQVRDAMKYLHEKKIIHRDIKPSNLLFHKQDGNIIVKLADFGFSRYVESDENNNENMLTTICGTPLYMSPELLLDMNYNSKADLWSFGIVMYELLHGSNPYCCIKNIQMLKKILKTKIITIDKKFSIVCINLLTKLLQINPNDRIDWNDFLNHEWFVMEVSKLNESINTNDNEMMFKMDEDISETKENVNLEEKIVNNYFTINEETIKNKDDYIFVDENFDYLKHKNIKTYQETISNSVINILSQSISYFLHQANSY